MSNITLCRLWERFLTKIGIRSSIMLISAIQRQEFTLVACKRGMCLMSMRHFLEAISDHTLRDHAQCNKVRQCKVGLAWPLLSNVIWLFHYSFFPFILNASWLTDLCRFGHPSHRNPHAWTMAKARSPFIITTTAIFTITISFLSSFFLSSCVSSLTYPNLLGTKKALLLLLLLLRIPITVYHFLKILQNLMSKKLTSRCLQHIME
jgi:hypothetical protein